MSSQKFYREYPIIACILFGLLMIFFYDVFFLNKTFKVTTVNSQALTNGVYGQANNKPAFIPVNGTDSPVLEEPVMEFIKNNLGQGILPLWNPHQACGYPLIGMLEVGIFFPLNAILYFFPQIFAWDILILSRFLIGGILTYWLMRTWGFRIFPALGAAIVFMFSGPMNVLQYWTVNVDILTPLLLLCLEKLIQRNTLRHVVLVALVVAATFFAGHPEHIFLVNVYGFIFFCCRVFSLARPKKINIKKIFLSLGGSYILGIGSSAMVLLPFLFNLVFEFWHGHPPGTGLTSGEVTERIITLAIPFFFQEVPLTYQFDFSGWWGGYLGTIPLALSAVGLFNRQKRGLNYFFAVLAFLIVSKAYGFPYINWIGYLPIFNTCRYAIHTPHLVAVSVAILSGMGIRAILLNKNVFRKGLCFSLLLVVLAGINLFLIHHSPNFPIAIKAVKFTAFILIAFQIILFLKDKKITKNQTIAIALITLLCFELFHYIHRGRVNRFNSFAPVPYIEFLKEQQPRSRAYGNFWAFYPDTASGFQVDDLGIFFSLLPKRFVGFVNHLFIKNHFRNDLRPPALRMVPITQGQKFLDLLNVKYLVTPPSDMMKQLLFNFNNLELFQHPVYLKEVDIYERPNAFARAFIAHHAIFETDDEQSLNLLKDLRAHLDQIIVINHPIDPQILDQLQSLPPQDRSQAKIIRSTPNEVILETTLENPGFLVLSDAYHPDWKAYVDGKNTKIYRTDYLIRSVFLEKGTHRVRFAFQPMSFYGGTLISCLVFLVLVCLWRSSADKKIG